MSYQDKNKTNKKRPSHQAKGKFNDNRGGKGGNQQNKKRSGREERPSESNEVVAPNEDFVFGRHAVTEALMNNRGNKLFLQEDLSGAKITELKELAGEYSVPISWAPKVKLDKLSDRGVHQGAVLGITPFEYLTLADLISQTKEKTEAPVFLLLDGLEDPHNFGSILRTADATGVNGVIIPKHRAVGITSIVTKTSTGAVEHVPVARVTNLKDAVRTLKENQFWVYGTAMDGVDYRQWQVSGPIALIIGNEGRGMSPSLQKDVDQLLTIPMVGTVQSLNAGVAAGLLMYEVFRKRNP